MRIREWVNRSLEDTTGDIVWHEDIWKGRVHLKWCIFKPGMDHIRSGKVLLMMVTNRDFQIGTYSHQNRNSYNFALQWLERKLAKQFGNWDDDNNLPKKTRLMGAKKEEQHIPVAFLILEKGQDIVPTSSYPKRAHHPEDKIAHLAA